MSFRGVLWGVLGVSATLTVALPTASSASCPTRTLTVTPAAQAAGKAITITGEHWFIGCDDTGQGTAPDHADFAITQLAHSYSLGSAQADADYRFTTTVLLPKALKEAPATITAVGAAGEATATVHVLRPDLAGTGLAHEWLPALGCALAGAGLLSYRRVSAPR